MTTTLNIKTASDIDPASEQVTPLFRLLRGEVKPFNGRHDPARRTLPRWERMDHSEPRKWKYDDPRRVIPQLIIGRVHAPPYPTMEEGKHMYVMSAAQVLDFVGVSEATAYHLQVAERALRALLGDPKKVFGRDRWLIHPRGNDDALNPNLAKKYRVPARRDFQWQDHFALLDDIQADED